MNVGLDYSNGSRTACLSKHFPATGVNVAILLSADGTPAPKDALADGIRPALERTVCMLMKQIEPVVVSTGSDDMFFISTFLTNTCKKINRMILDISIHLGQAIYIGGVIMYHIAGRVLYFTFGGGTVYSCKNGSLKKEGIEKADVFTRNSLGSCDVWDCDMLQGIADQHSRYYLTSRPLPDVEKAAQLIRNNGADGSHPDTMPMLLVRELSMGSAYPAAVMEIRFEPTEITP